MTSNLQPLTIKKKRAAFTLIELLMVIVIMAILIGLLLPVLMPSREDAKRRKRSIDQSLLATAIKSYRHEYMKWPNPSPGNSGVYAENNVEVVKVLTGEEDPDQPIKFINPGAFSQSESGSLRDPDGKYYTVEFDGNKVYVDGKSVEDF